MHAGRDRPSEGSGVAVPSPGTVWRAGRARGGEGRWWQRAAGSVRRWCSGKGGGGGGVGGGSGVAHLRVPHTHTLTFTLPLSLASRRTAPNNTQFVRTGLCRPACASGVFRRPNHALLLVSKCALSLYACSVLLLFTF